jgi:hypothetical protein
MLEAVDCRVEPVVTHPPPQTRTCAMHASGSSGRAAAARAPSIGLSWSGLVRSQSLPVSGQRRLCPTAPSLPWVPWAAVPHLRRDDAPLRLPPCPSRGASLVARHPDTLPASTVRGLRCRLVARWKPPSHARAFGPPVPLCRHLNQATGGAPKFPSSHSEGMPRSQTPVGSWALAIARPDCCLPALANRRLSPHTEGHPLDHNYTHFGAP